MKKAEFIKAVAEALDTTQVDARRITDGVFGVVEEAMVEGKKVPLGGLGKLGTVERAARKGHNPATGEELQIPARTAPKFFASASLKELVR